MTKTYLWLAAILIFVWNRAQGALDIPVDESLEVLQNNAAAGDAYAQFNLAVSYQEGQKAPKDSARALKLFRKAAAAGVSEAQFNIGVLLMSGVDVPRDPKEAARWMDEAAKNGFFEAQLEMVRIYDKGDGMEKSPAKALDWDLLARRTLELRYGVPAGLPPKPGVLRADGAAEVIGGHGEKEWILPDGSREKTDAAGVRHIEHKNGSKTTVQTDGAWETIYPSGLSEQVTAQGRKTLRNANGQVEITEPDGARIMEGDGTSSTGVRVRIRDTFNPEGKRIIHTVIQGDTTYEERADGAKVLETRVKRNDGVDLILTEKVSDEGAASDGRLRRADNGAGPKDSEIWEIRRKLHLRGGDVGEVLERYSETGLFFQGQVKRVAEAPPPTGVPVKPGKRIIMPVAMPAGDPFRPAGGPGTTNVPPSYPVVSTVRRGFEDPTAFAPKPDITPFLRELAQIEAEARNFAGATDADYKRAQAAAAAYLIPLSTQPPQKAASPPTWFRERTITQAALRESPLVPILDDRSNQVPFGPYGAALIKRYPWKHAETEHFIVHYLGEAEARLTVQYIEGAYVIVTQLLNLDPQRGQAKSHVFVFPENEWIRYRTTENLPAHLAGFAFKTELLLGAATDRQDRAESIKVLCHEVTHALVARFYGARRPPLWLNEGLAEYMALRTMRAKGVLTASTAQGEKKAGAMARTSEDLARFVGRPDPKMDVDRLFNRVRYGNRTSPDRMAAFYANSQKCLQVLFEKLPVEGFSKFFNTLLAGNRPDVALAVAYGAQCDSVAAFQRLVNATGL